MKSDKWNVSVSELMEIFRGSLVSLVPWMEQAKIPWREGEAYDDWENIAEAIFKSVVCSALSSNTLAEYPIPRYGFQYEKYDGSYINVMSSNERESTILVFVGYETISTTFDTVRVAQIDNAGFVSGFLTLEYQDANFRYCSIVDGQRQYVNEVTVRL